jgi:hypothetical protein
LLDRRMLDRCVAILWAIIRGAVLSALRKHHDETRGAATAAGYQHQLQPQQRGDLL